MNMNLIRDMLKVAGKSKGAVDAGVFVSDITDFHRTAYHIDLMRQGGLIEASITKNLNGLYEAAKILALTYEGNEFLSLIASDDIWSAVKRKIAITLGDTSYEITKKLAVEMHKTLLNLN